VELPPTSRWLGPALAPATPPPQARRADPDGAGSADRLEADPEGVLNVVGIRSAAPVEHPDAKIAHRPTDGARHAGRAEIKRVTLELGGKSANVVFEDADLERAAAAAPYSVFDNAGQDCCARSRILVQKSVYDAFLDRFIEATRGVKVGDPSLEETEMGPLISAEHRATVASYVEGTSIAFRGEAPESEGFWFPCTIVEATNDDRIAREEVFGPVVAVIPFEDEADAIRIANDTPYGLSGSIWTRDGARALRVARGIDAGVLSVNANTSVRVQTPFGGFKQSGFGRELGMHALEGYSEVKSVFISTEG
jgi:acyl-CoA reductase-like NAD-dependent aldehyde dehydrogenase